MEVVLVTHLWSQCGVSAAVEARDVTGRTAREVNGGITADSPASLFIACQIRSGAIFLSAGGSTGGVNGTFMEEAC